MTRLFALFALLFLALPVTAQTDIATPWVEMIDESLVIETQSGEDQAVKIVRKRLPSWQPAMGQLLAVRAEIAANYGTADQFGIQTPFRYMVEQLGASALPGYNGTYGSVTMIAVGDQMAGGMSAWIGMCGGQSLTGFDGTIDGAGTSGHASGNQIGAWSQTAGWVYPSVPQAVLGGVDGSGQVPITMLLTAQGFITQWDSPHHYMRKWQTRASIDGERALSLKVRLVYTTL